MSKYCDYCSEEAVHHWCAGCAVDPRIATLEAQRDALLVAIKRLRALFAGDPGGKFVVMREGGEGASFADQLLVGEAMTQADIAIDAAAQSGFMEDGAWWPAEARKEGVVYDGDCP